MSTATVPVQFRPPPRRPAASVAAVVVAGAIAVVSLGLFLAAGVLLWGESQKDAQGFVSTGSDPFATPTAAIVTQDLDVDLAGTGWALGPDRYGKVRLQVTPRNDKPVFVGIAPTREVAGLPPRHRAQHADGHRLHAVPGRLPAPRGHAPRHAARGRVVLGGIRLGCKAARTMTWDVEDGSWSVVVMNADGSRGVDAGVRAGAEAAAPRHRGLDRAGRRRRPARRRRRPGGARRPPPAQLIAQAAAGTGPAISIPCREASASTASMSGGPSAASSAAARRNASISAPGENAT